jgi:hypothetical protein
MKPLKNVQNTVEISQIPLPEVAIGMNSSSMVKIFGNKTIDSCFEQIKSVRGISDVIINYHILLEKISKLSSSPELKEENKDELERLANDLSEINSQIKSLKRIGTENQMTDLEEYQEHFIDYLNLLRRSLKTSLKEKLPEIKSIDINKYLNPKLKDIIPKGINLNEGYFKDVINKLVDSILLANGESSNLLEMIEAKILNAARLLNDIKESGLFKSLDNDTYLQFFYQIVNQSTFSDYTGEIVIGFGGSEDDINIRLCSYVLPAIKILQSYQNYDIIPPKVRLLNGSNSSSLLNQANNEIMANNANQSFDLIKRFIEEFYPEFATNFEYSIPSVEDFTENKLYAYVLKELVDYSTKNPEDKALKSLLRKSHKHNNKLKNKNFEELSEDEIEFLRYTSLRYVACHIVESGSGNIRTHKRSQQPRQYLIEIGGKGEDDFNCLKRMVLLSDLFKNANNKDFYRLNTLLGQNPKPIQLQAKVGGNPPVYYSAGDNEILVSDLHQKNINIKLITGEDIKVHYKKNYPEAANDILAFEQIGINLDEYLTFLKK